MMALTTSMSSPPGDRRVPVRCASVGCGRAQLCLWSGVRSRFPHHITTPYRTDDRVSDNDPPLAPRARLHPGRGPAAAPPPGGAGEAAAAAGLAAAEAAGEAGGGAQASTAPAAGQETGLPEQPPAEAGLGPRQAASSGGGKSGAAVQGALPARG